MLTVEASCVSLKLLANHILTPHYSLLITHYSLLYGEGKGDGDGDGDDLCSLIIATV